MAELAYWQANIPYPVSFVNARPHPPLTRHEVVGAIVEASSRSLSIRHFVDTVLRNRYDPGVSTDEQD
jgi:hypothetical protein